MRRLILERRLWPVPIAIWTVVVMVSFVWNWQTLQSYAEEMALNRARFVTKMVESMRLWNARHGGVYAEVDETTQPNPHLEIPERDIYSPSGKLLTKLNPAYMTRQIADVVMELSGMRMRLTSLKPLNEDNAADAWEKEALTAFERGEKTRHSFVDRDGQLLFRYMSPLRTKKPCLLCHEKQGYRIGDIRGGVSIAFPAAELLQAQSVHERNQIAVHLAAWLILCGLTLFASSRFRRQMLSLGQRLHAEEMVFAISSRFAGLRDIEEAVDLALEDLRSTMDADDACILYIHGSGRWERRLSNGDAVRNEICAVGYLPEEERDNYVERLRRGEPVSALHRDGTYAFIMVPLFASDEFIGTIELTDVREPGVFADENFTLLKMAAGVMGAAIERSKAEQQTQRLLEENRHLARQSMTIQEQERANLARELHDELGQCLTAIRADAESICTQSRDKLPAIFESGRAIADVADRVYSVVRSIMRRLRPEMLDALGLGEAVEQMVSEWRGRYPDIEWRLAIEGELGNLPETTQITAFRVIQEAMTNVVKHANATRVDIRLSRAECHTAHCVALALEVCDDGRGMGEEAVHHGLGLLGMRERVLAVGGRFEAGPLSGPGHCIRARFPLGTEPAGKESAEECCVE